MTERVECCNCGRDGDLDEMVYNMELDEWFCDESCNIGYTSGLADFKYHCMKEGR